jgi:hypothetical protein
MSIVQRLQTERERIARARYGLSYCQAEFSNRGSALRQIVATVLVAKRQYLKRGGF